MPSPYAPGRYRATPTLGGGARHLALRFSYGLTPELVSAVKGAGGGLAWFDAQLDRPYDATADASLCDWWPDLHLDAATIWQRQVSGGRGTWEVMSDYARRLLVRRMTSPHQVHEVMTDFWESHLHVPANGDSQGVWRASYGDVVRRHALGRFDELLVEAVTHPAMLIFLDNATSTKSHPNENLGRELLELHTVGVGAHTEADVKASARILTGWRVDLWRTWEASYSPQDHWTGPVAVGDFRDANTDPDGRRLTRRYLRHLAHHPATARRIARKLATKFISDTPSEQVVDELAEVYLAHDTAVAPVLRALVRTQEFRKAKGQKLRDPAEDVVASYRALGAEVVAPGADDHAANAVLWQSDAVGMRPAAWPRPDGPPLHGDPWASPSRALASMEVHWSLAGGWWPKKGVTWQSPQQWAPELPIEFRDLVDHLSRAVHGRRSSRQLLRAACDAVETRPGERITGDHRLMAWQFNRLLGVLLDHPHHYHR